MMNEMTIISAEYTTQSCDTIRATIQVGASPDDVQEMFIPLDPDNRHYSEILRQVEAGVLVIEEAAQ